jgi:feruloyl esterase
MFTTQSNHRINLSPTNRGGVGTDQCDFLTALIEWVEKGVAPKQIVASQSRGGKVVRTRPLCPYPQVAKRNGTGNPDDAQSFVCANPDAASR